MLVSLLDAELGAEGEQLSVLSFQCLPSEDCEDPQTEGWR